eukprot:gene9990-11663_t
MAVTDELYQQLLRALEKRMPLSLNFKIKLKDLLFDEHFKRGTCILHPREIQKRVWFILKGSAREFITDPNVGATDLTLWFWFEDDFLYTTPGFFSQEPTQSSIEVLEDSHMIYLEVESFMLLRNQAEEVGPLSEKIRDHYTKMSVQHQLFLRIGTAEEKYDRIFKQHPALFNHAKQKDIATFLDMSPDTLGRMRKVK